MRKEEANEIVTVNGIYMRLGDFESATYTIAYEEGLIKGKKEAGMNRRMATAMSPEEFKNRMIECSKDWHQEDRHIEMDSLMCELLTQLGYEEGIAVFQSTDKWYS